MSEESCIFCDIVAGKIPCYKVYEDERTLAFMDVNPVTPGHVLVIPKSHYENLIEMVPGDLAATHQTAQKVTAAIMNALKPGGVAVLQLNGKGANQVVMHYHVHLIPRNRPKDKLKILEWAPKKGNTRSIKSKQAKITEAL
ncbi:MAG: HIT family protein [Desulfarculaceae bacterium]|nr:HIT family protein [Desulfarculaceae bacterium]